MISQDKTGVAFSCVFIHDTMQAFKLFKGQHIPKFNATTFHVNGQYKLNNNWRQFTTAQPSPAIEMKTNLDAPKDFVNTNDFFRNRKVCNIPVKSIINFFCKVLLVGIVGAFTGVCDNQVTMDYAVI